MTVIFVEFIDQLIDYLINCASLIGKNIDQAACGLNNLFVCFCVYEAYLKNHLFDDTNIYFAELEAKLENNNDERRVLLER